LKNLIDENTARFAKAIASSGQSIERHFQIADATITLQFADKKSSISFCQAIAHLEIERSNASDLKVFIWDKFTSGISAEGLPKESTTLFVPNNEIADKHSNEITMSSSGDEKMVYESGYQSFSLFDLQKKRAVFWCENANALPNHFYGAPLRTILQWWSETRGLNLVHGGGIGGLSGGVLISGRGGIGKSTVCLSTLDSDLLYAGDDYVAIDIGGSNTLYSIYNSGKLSADSLAKVPEIRKRIMNPKELSHEKGIVFIHSGWPEKMIKSFTLKAILVPSLSDQKEASLSKMRSGEALRAIAPSTMFQLRGDNRTTFTALGELVRSIPCFKLELGRSMGNVPSIITELIN
jgi:hypothetical protein